MKHRQTHQHPEKPAGTSDSSPLKRREVAIIVAHPDDETLWCGGLMLQQRFWKCHVVTLCRGSDPDREPRFRRALQRYGATGALGDLDDGPEQTPLTMEMTQETILRLLPHRRFDLIITHGPHGEYTWHRRHEECCFAVVDLWCSGRLQTSGLWLFAYDDSNGSDLPRAHPNAHVQRTLSVHEWIEKRKVLADVYGFAPDSWEVRAAACEEGFWCFETPEAARAHVMACAAKT